MTPYLSAFLLSFLADRATKHLVYRHMAEEEKREMIPQKVYLWHRKNCGMAYGFLHHHLTELTWLTGFGIGAGLFYFFGLPSQPEQKAKKFGLALLFGGALGNWYERCLHKRVTDFIYIKGKHAPVFNIADVCIWVGGGLVALTECLSGKASKK